MWQSLFQTASTVFPHVPLSDKFAMRVKPGFTLSAGRLNCFQGCGIENCTSCLTESNGVEYCYACTKIPKLPLLLLVSNFDKTCLFRRKLM